MTTTYSPARYAKIRAVILAALKTGKKRRIELSEIARLTDGSTSNFLQDMVREGLIFSFRGKVDTEQTEAHYFDNEPDRDTFAAAYAKLEAVRKIERERKSSAAGNVRKKAARAVALAAKRAAIEANKEARRIADNEKQRAKRAADKAAKSAQVKAKVAKKPAAKKPEKVYTKKQGDFVSGLSIGRDMERKRAEFKASNKSDYVLTESDKAKIKRYPTPPNMGNRAYVDPASVPRFSYSAARAA